MVNCQPVQEDNTKIRAAIVAQDEKFMEAFNKGAAAGIAALYTEDGQLLPPNSDFVSGKEAVQKFWQGAMDMGVKSAELETVEVEGMGKMACEVGKYTLFADGEQMIDSGKYIVIWKKGADSQWKLHRDIWTSSMPIPEQK